jgi:hypothetical protein
MDVMHPFYANPLERRRGRQHRILTCFVSIARRLIRIVGRSYMGRLALGQGKEAVVIFYEELVGAVAAQAIDKFDEIEPSLEEQGSDNESNYHATIHSWSSALPGRRCLHSAGAGGAPGRGWLLILEEGPWFPTARSDEFSA